MPTRYAPLGLALLLPMLASADPLAPATPAHLEDFEMPTETQMLLLPRGAVRWQRAGGHGFAGTPWRDGPQLARALRRTHAERHRRGRGMKVAWVGNFEPDGGYYQWVAKSTTETIWSEAPIVPVGSALLSIQHASGQGTPEVVRVIGLAAAPGYWEDQMRPDREERILPVREWVPVDLLFFAHLGGEDEIRHLLARILSPNYRVRAVPLSSPYDSPQDHERIDPGRFRGPFGL